MSESNVSGFNATAEEKRAQGIDAKGLTPWARRWQSVPKHLRARVLVETFKGESMDQLIELYAPKEGNDQESIPTSLPV